LAVDRSQQVTQAPDGRSLVFAEWGDLDGSPVFAARDAGLPAAAAPGRGTHRLDRRAVALGQTRHGVWGWVDDSLAQIWPWGFDPATISVSTQIWYGTQDVLSPPGHSEWLARTVPGAIVRRTGLGHFGDPDADTVERLTWLTGGAG
jgi:pimeloyl-ACP methyl ester carboxylesterase